MPHKIRYRCSHSCPCCCSRASARLRPGGHGTAARRRKRRQPKRTQESWFGMPPAQKHQIGAWEAAVLSIHMHVQNGGTARACTGVVITFCDQWRAWAGPGLAGCPARVSGRRGGRTLDDEMTVTHFEAAGRDSNALAALSLDVGAFWDLVLGAVARLAPAQDCGDHT